MAQTAAPANKTTAPAAKSTTAAKSAGTKSAEAKTAPAAGKTLSKPVITISGVCPAGTAGNKAFSPTCKTVVTEAQLEKLINALNPDMPASVRRNLGGSLAEWTAFAAKAHELGMDNSPEFAETMRFARTQLLATTLMRKLQKQAETISPAEMQSYYDAHKDQFEEFNLQRVIVPRETPSKDKPVDEAAEKQFAQQLRDRLAKGEDAKTLQTEAFKHSGQTSPEPPVDVNQRKKNSLPASQAKVFELKPGEVSEVLVDPSAFFIYKMVSSDAPTLEKVTPEVKKMMATERYGAEMKELNSQFKIDLDESYFGPAPQQSPMGTPSLRPQGAQPPARVAPTTPPAAQAAPTKGTQTQTAPSSAAPATPQAPK